MKKFILFSVILVLLGAVAFTITTTNTITTKNLQKESVSGGNLVADAVRDAGNADIAFVGSCDLKEVNLSSNNPSDDDIVNMLVLKSSIINTIDMTGDQIKSALEKSVSIYPKNNPGFLQVSGLNVTFDSSAKADSKITSITTSNGQLDLKKTYKVALSYELTNGAFGYWRIWSNSNAKPTNITMEQALRAYIIKPDIPNITDERISD